MEGATEVRQTGDYAKALKKLEKGQVLLRNYSLDSPLLCLQMSQVRRYFGKWEVAEDVLRQGLKLLSSPQWALQLRNCLIELYHQRQLYDETAQLGDWTLSTLGHCQHHSELLRALFFLTDAYYQIDEEVKGFALVDR